MLIRSLFQKHVERRGGEQPYEASDWIASTLAGRLDRRGIGTLIDQLADYQQDEYRGRSRKDETLALLADYGIDLTKFQIK